jgi:hypothetical protein
VVELVSRVGDDHRPVCARAFSRHGLEIDSTTTKASGQRRSRRSPRDHQGTAPMSEPTSTAVQQPRRQGPKQSHS